MCGARDVFPKMLSRKFRDHSVEIEVSALAAEQTRDTFLSSSMLVSLSCSSRRITVSSGLVPRFRRYLWQPNNGPSC